MEYLSRESVVDMGDGLGFAYTYDPDRDRYRIVRVTIDDKGNAEIDSSFWTYTNETYKEERDAKARVAWFTADAGAEKRRKQQGLSST